MAALRTASTDTSVIEVNRYERQRPPIGVDEDHGVTRRSALRMGAVAGATVVVAATGVLSYRVFNGAILDPDGGAAFDPWRSWRDDDGPLGIVGGAILAANPHNSQSWQFAVDESAIDVYADRARRLGSIDVVDRELHVGLGCGLENLVLAARARGFAPVVTLVPVGTDGDLVARVALSAQSSAASTEPSNLYEFIGDRHTNRGPYTSEQVTDEVLAGLVDTSDLDDVDVVWITDPDAMDRLGQMLIDAARAITADEQQSIDGFAWFRSNDDAIQLHRDGLTLDEQGLAPLTLTLAKLLPASSRSAGDKFWLDQTRDVHTKTAAAYGVVTATNPYDIATQLDGGRLLQRTQLAATRDGIAFQHMNQITERIDRDRSNGVTPTFGPRFDDLLPIGAQPLATFRVGYAVRDAPLSPRRPISEVMR